MTSIYYTTADIKEMFGWKSDMTIYRKRESGFLPEPDLPGKPNKWLRVKIDTIIGIDANPEIEYKLPKQ